MTAFSTQKTYQGSSKAESATTLVSHVICPNCWHQFRVHEIVWVAKHQDLRGDPVLGDDAQIRFRPTHFNTAREALDARGMACQILACPRCHLQIPRIFLEYKPLFFSIIGSPGSGKSYFLAAMTWQLRQVLPRHFSVSLTDADTTGNLILNGYERTLFQQTDDGELVSIEKTEMEGELYVQITLKDQPVLLPRPFLFMMRPTGNHIHAAAHADFGRMLCLYDNAGEHFLPGADSSLHPGTQHMARSRVLMFLYDPTQVPRFRNECRRISKDPQLSDLIKNASQHTVLTEAALQIRQHAGLPSSHKLDKPLLVIVAKSDVWSGLVDEDLVTEPYLADEGGDNLPQIVDLCRIKRVSGALRKVLLNLTPEFVSVAEDAFEHVYYIPVSSLGRSPEVKVMEDGKNILEIRPRDIQPRWVTVPLVYAFAKWSTGLIEGTASST